MITSVQLPITYPLMPEELLIQVHSQNNLVYSVYTTIDEFLIE